jgi:hypothetical protein
VPRALFVRRKDTRSDTHDTLRCKRCRYPLPPYYMDNRPSHRLSPIA